MGDAKKDLTPFGGGVPVLEKAPPPFDGTPLPRSEDAPPPLNKFEEEFLKNPPPHPCVGCGHCCFSSQCNFSLSMIGQRSGVCSFLIFDGDRYRCTQVDHPRLRYEVGIGEGCCSPLFNERRRAQISWDKRRGKTPSPPRNLTD